MSVPWDVSTPGCQYPGMSVSRDVSIPGCQYPGMSVSRDVSSSECQNSICNTFIKYSYPYMDMVADAPYI